MMKYLICKKEDFQKFTSLAGRTKQQMSTDEQIRQFNLEMEETRKKNEQINAAGAWEVGPVLTIPEDDIKKLNENILILYNSYLCFFKLNMPFCSRIRY